MISLHERVERVMRRDFVAVPSREPLRQALDTMRLGRLRHLLVVDGPHLVGVISYRDALERQLATADPDAAALRVADAMAAVPSTLDPSTTLQQAAARICSLHIGCLPVVRRGNAGLELLGIVTESDLLRAAYLSCEP